ncbi:hypothetical protein Tco_1029228 [Tanacetum coccineum]|uniref:Xylulose kinase-1 n=1 Tax=Tanacetum coccineum TaxID=301880 RepID=A0ABQ5G4K2_9ASTR
MVALKFTSSYNIVAFLDKPTEGDGFEQIVDFLNTHSIKYTLTVNPTIYTSCIEQFWTTAKVKTVNERVRIQALVDKKKVITLETIKTNQALEIDSLKRRLKKLKKKKGSRTHRLIRLFKVGRSAQVVSSKDEGLGAQEDASKQGRKITDLDADLEVTLVDEAQGRNDDNLMFDTGVLDEQEFEVEKVVSTTEVTTAIATTTTVDELTLA